MTQNAQSLKARTLKLEKLPWVASRPKGSDPDCRTSGLRRIMSTGPPVGLHLYPSWIWAVIIYGYGTFHWLHSWPKCVDDNSHWAEEWLRSLATIRKFWSLSGWVHLPQKYTSCYAPSDVCCTNICVWA